ncbi:hypothetical protein HK102_007314, partial [Quaeritorhiza haematococci]
AVFWTKVPNRLVVNTIWKHVATDAYADASPSPYSSLSPVVENSATQADSAETLGLNLRELDQLFGRNNEGSDSGRSPTKRSFESTRSTSSTDVVGGLVGMTGTSKKTMTTLLDFNRANNIAIMLARIRMSYKEIRDAILGLDDEKLTLENLKVLRQYAPTEEEIDLVRDFSGDISSLGNAERYIREVMVIPRFRERLDGMIFRRRFATDVKEISPELDGLRKAISQVRSSRKLSVILREVLKIGNYLNGSSFRGNAYGFQIDALLKLKDTKATDVNAKQTPTLLHYMARHLRRVDGHAKGTKKTGSILEFLKEMPDVEFASRVCIPALLTSTKNLRDGLRQISNEIKEFRRLGIRTEYDLFLPVMMDFVSKAEGTVARLEQDAVEMEMKMKDLQLWFGEDPDAKLEASESFFGVLVMFSTMLNKAAKENDENERRAKRQ